MAFTLDLIKPGDGEATRYSLEDGSYIIGRGASCALQLPELDVSDRHALLMLRGRKARLEDLHSANGTYATITLEVSPREAELLVFYEQIKGRISLALRNRDDTYYEKELPQIDIKKIGEEIEELNKKRQSELNGGR